MKDYWPLEKRPLPNHKERGFFQACKLSAKEHGYTGFLASARKECFGLCYFRKSWTRVIFVGGSHLASTNELTLQ